MKKTDALYQLITSLTRGEKRNFRMLAQLTAGDKKYLQIFDALDLMDEYDEAKLLKKFKNDPTFEKQLAYNKNYLYNSILNALVYFRKSQDAERSSLSLQVRILLEKNLYTHAKKLLRKTKDKIKETEKFEELVSLLQLEVEILQRTEPVELLAESFRQVDSEERIAFEKILNLRDYRKLEQQAHLLLTTAFVARKATDLAEGERILAHPCMAEETCALSIRGKIFYNEIQRKVAWHRGDRQQTLAFASRAVQLWEANPQLIESEKYLYMIHVSQLAHIQNLVEGVAVGLPTVMKIRHTDASTAQERLLRFERYYAYALALSMDTGQKVTEAFMAEFDTEFSFLNSEFEVSTRLQVSYFKSLYHFVQAQYSEALHWVNKVINHPRTNTRADIQTFARILNMMIHFELGNLDYIESTFKSAYRFIYKMNRMNKFERRLLNHFRRLVLSPDPDSIQQEFERCKADIAVIVQDPFENQATAFIKAEEWIESKVTGRTVADILAENNEKAYKLEGIRIT